MIEPQCKNNIFSVVINLMVFIPSFKNFIELLHN